MINRKTLGPKSRAGLIAKPQLAPKVIAIMLITPPIKIGCIDLEILCRLSVIK